MYRAISLALTVAAALPISIPFQSSARAIGGPLFKEIFKTPKPIIAAVMLEGTYTTPDSIEQVLDKAFRQLAIAEEAGMDGILFELRGGGILKPRVTPARRKGMIEIMKSIIQKARHAVIGVEVLWHYPEETLLVAKQSGARFVRLDFFSDEMIADGVRVPIDPEAVKNLQLSLDANDIALFTDIQVKYAEMVDKTRTITESATIAETAGSQGVIVTGRRSGSPPDPERVRLAQVGTKDIEVIIGSGFSVTNAEALLAHADGAIVGTSISTETGGELIPEKVRALMAVVRKIRKETVPR